MLKIDNRRIISQIWRQSFLICFGLLQAYQSKGQCQQNYSWASWQDFTGRQAAGTIVVGKKTIHLTITANYDFSSESSIYRVDRFSGFSGYKDIPKATVPATEWSKRADATTTLCFSEPVTNPILLYSSLGRANTNDYQKVTLTFSQPYSVLYDAGGTAFIDSYSLSGLEGNAVILFPGTFSCITIYSQGTEKITDLNWGLQTPLVPVSIDEAKECGQVSLTAQGGATYQWSGGDQPNQAINTVRTSGVYSVTATDQNGCKSVALKNVTVTPGTTPTIKSDETICLESAVVTLHAGASAPNLTYLWTPINSTDSTLVATQPGTYTVTIASSAGCQASRRIDVRAAGLCAPTIFAPDVFTPNGDQINDLFNLVVVNGTPIQLTIYDHWGTVIYSIENSNPMWDGTYRGNKCLAGIYPYVLTYKSTSSDEIFTYRGQLMLLR